MKIDLKLHKENQFFLSFFSKKELELLIEVFKSGGYLDLEFRKIKVGRKFLKLYFDDMFFLIKKKKNKWIVDIKGINGEYIDIDVNTRALMELLENKINQGD